MPKMINRFLMTTILAIIGGCGMLNSANQCDQRYGGICEVLETERRVDIIVTLQGASPGETESIQALQNEFLARLPESISVGRVYKVTPQLALETDHAGFTFITQHYPDAEIALDETRTLIKK